MEIFNPPGVMNFSSGNVAESWKRWLQKFNNFLILSEKYRKPDATKIAMLLNFLGDEGVSIYKTFKFQENSETFPSVITKFEEYCILCKNVVFERFKFFSCSQQEGQSVDVYLTQLKTLAASCEFGDQEESLIRDRVVLGVHNRTL
ncbi:hypothetical protein AVEN_29038-1 [Araneus ventricosus]|uniref:Retrotransposon gag domain-containing protein n=1 Tax=Araneus ventricosus TaxID=182803 RepID=A0A4Y2AJW8_ARAVE|nr:hypothetical protein AVEN_29038-1 [Araneus ventricosus]